MAKLSINRKRLNARLDHLASLTEPGKPWERTAFSDLHLAGRAWLMEQMRDIGLTVSLDAAANLIGTLPGQGNGLSPIAVGSHSDTVPSGGRYDGVAGVVVALEIAQSIIEAGHRLKHPFEAIDFLAEEPNRYGISCVGSRAMVGDLTAEMLQYTAPDGSTLAQGIAKMGGDPSALTAALRTTGDVSAFLEMHIEQARVLEAANEDIGVVTSIAGVARVEVTVQGVADHSGATPMNLRRDAMAGAAELVLAYEERANSETRAPMVATVGKLDVYPNAANAVPGKVVFTLEFRCGARAVLDDFFTWSQDRAAAMGKARDLGVKTRMIGQSIPSPMDGGVQSVLLNVAQNAGFRVRKMPSGAGHDAAYIARIAPTGMVFIPCLAGRSHCPEEYATPEQLQKGAQTLLDAVLHLDETLN